METSLINCNKNIVCNLNNGFINLDNTVSQFVTKVFCKNTNLWLLCSLYKCKCVSEFNSFPDDVYQQVNETLESFCNKFINSKIFSVDIFFIVSLFTIEMFFLRMLIFWDLLSTNVRENRMRQPRKVHFRTPKWFRKRK